MTRVRGDLGGRQQRSKRNPLPDAVFDDPDSYLRDLFGGFEAVVKAGEVWCVKASGMLRPIGTSREIRDSDLLGRRLRQLGVIPPRQTAPIGYGRKELLPVLRRSLHLRSNQPDQRRT